MGEIPKDFDEAKFVNDLIRYQTALGSHDVLFTAKQAEFLRGLCEMMGREDAFDTMLTFWLTERIISILPTGDIILNEDKEGPTMDDWRGRLNP